MDSGKLVKSTPKLLLLKDYLLDDFSSCSSNGFRSYPRRQCCTTVGFLLEIDMKRNSKQGTCNKKPPKLIKNSQSHPKSSPSSQKLSAFQKASLAVINAVKHFPFPKSLSTQTHTKSKLSLIPRTLSKKLLKRTFWKKNDLKEIEPSKKRQDMVVVAEPMGVEKSNHPIFSPAKMVVVEANSSVTDSSKKSDSWSDSDFTVTTTSDDSFCVKNDVVLREAVESVGDDCESMEVRTATTTMSSGTNSITNSEVSFFIACLVHVVFY
ncbi:hypothetical protein LIER_34444 [Lithospermum erythrorhizon]|uniref:Uncharacterized protein n=1 Tax=Lithospermum erythrorhizon TaxID=34254 RepID=A0AAV3S3Q4_LITER